MDREKRRGGCPICGGIGYLITRDAAGYEYADPCRCEIRRRAMRRLEASGLKRLAERCTFDTFRADTEKAAQIKGRAEAYARDPQGWFFIGGQTGAGKTHICTAICGELINRGKFLRYMRWAADSEELKEAKKDGSYSEKVGAFKRAEVLYIDDLFKAKPTEADIKLAFEIIAGRYEEDLPTIISSELTIGAIINADEAIGGRIIEKTRAENIIAVKRDPAANHRTTKKAQEAQMQWRTV